MIRGFRHKGLKLLYDRGDRRRVRADQAARIERVLARLDQAGGPDDMDLPGFRLHPLRGAMAGYWAVTISANWRIVFRFEDGHAGDVDLIDYH